MFKAIQNFIATIINLDRSTKVLLQISFDTLASSIAFFTALALRLEKVDYFYKIDTYIGVLIVIISTFCGFALQGLYKNITRFFSIETTYSIIIGSVLSCSILFCAILLLKLDIPLSVSFIFGILLCVFVSGMRLIIRDLSQNINKKEKEPIAIYVEGPSDFELMKTFRQHPNYSVRLLIDDNPELDGKKLGSTNITNFDRAKTKLRRLKIKTLFLVNPPKNDVIRQKLFNIISDYSIKIKTIPSASNLISSKFKLNELKDIKIEDLLGREPAEPNDKLMKKNISKKIVLVTGAGGSIGSELCRQIVSWKPKKLILIDVSEFAIYNLFEELKKHPYINESDLIPLIGSVQDRNFIKKVFDRYMVNTIYHAAAYKHVPLMEMNVMQCIENNVFGTLNLAEFSIVAKVENFILVSTDKAVNPTNFMGASKRLAEILCQSLSEQNIVTCFTIVRFGNVLGSSGSVVPLFKKQIENGGPITVTHEEVSRYFMTIPEAVQLVIQSGSISKGGDVFVLDMGKSIKILDLAKRMIYLSGCEPILNKYKNLKDNEIGIIISGLRSGEKLFEELSYNPNLIGTDHPRINTVVEASMKSHDLKSLLSIIDNAIRENDYQKLFHNIAKVANGISNINSSTDVFLQNKVDKQGDTALIYHTKNSIN